MAIILNHINYKYSIGTAYEKQALKDINLTIENGEFIGIIGHTGSGKSTLIQHLNGLIKATSGSIFFHGEDIYDKDYNLKLLRSKVGLVFQYPEYQLFETTVFKDICFGPKNLGLPELEVQMRAYDAMKMVGLSESLLDASPLELSGGQKRRVAIAGVLAMQPDTLILDEPTAGLDPKGRDDILNQLDRLHQERSITILLVSHSMEDIAKYVNRIVVMDHGEIVYDEKPKEVFSHYKELEMIGLGAPQVTYIMNGLKDTGFSVSTSPTTVEEAEKEILKWVQVR